MKALTPFRWSRWSIATKIVVPFLGMSIVTMGIIAYVAISNIRTVGKQALETSNFLGQTAIGDSTQALTSLGEDMIGQTASRVGKQLEVYLNSHPHMTLEEMRADADLRAIAIQPVGTTGYTTILDSTRSLIVVHKYPELEKDFTQLREKLPSFWAMVQTRGPTSGYYDWQEVDGSITKKYAAVTPIVLRDGSELSLWATTYIEEFSQPVLKTQRDINAAIATSSQNIKRNTDNIQQAFILVITSTVIVVIALSLLISWAITNPIFKLKAGAEAIGKGNLDYKLNISSRDELGDLANTFGKMGAALKSHTEELKRSAELNIAREREIQDNLRLYAQKVSEAQESERKRVSRDLHDDTLQALVVISRQLEELGTDGARSTPETIKAEIHRVIDGVRRFSQELRPSILDDLGLIPAVKWLASDLVDHGIPVEVVIEGTTYDIGAESELMLFRVVQEAITNVRKHSNASRALISIGFGRDHIDLTIQDDGAGFAVPDQFEALTGRGKLGLVGMQERVQLLNGRLNVSSQPGKGTTVTISVPRT